MTLVQRHLGRLRGRTAWIIGGRRIGQFVSRALAEQGVHIAAHCRDSRKEAEQMARQARAIGVRALVVQGDASDPRAMKRCVQEIRRKFGRLDILVLMASVFWPTPIPQIRPEDWSANFKAHVLGTFWPVQAALPLLRRGAHIITIADRTSVGPAYPDFLPYVATKAAVEGMTRAMARELGPRGIFVNAIAPGPIRPPAETPRAQWQALRRSSAIRFPIDDREAQEQFALLVVYLSILTLASGGTYPLDQGQNL